ncbi:MAG: DUF2802 domain-containing protein [Gammaproteobacteria bacterium]|nr:DUF2802 domain-containing protein [Gammaproteobacteria bacterium]MCF6261681.1 DUF2802 domain-containing protein [Gammaproteobacteria bacterium]
MIAFSFEVIASVALVVGLVALVFAYFKNTQLQLQINEQQNSLYALQADVSAMCSGAVNLGEHLAHLEQRAHLLTRRQDQLEMKEPATQSYRQARKMMNKGAELEEVIADCGIARGEAELVALAQRIKKAS